MDEEHNQEVANAPDAGATPPAVEKDKLPAARPQDESIYAVPMDLPGDTKKKRAKWKVLVPLAVGVVLLAAGGYLFITSKSSKQPEQQSTNTPQEAQPTVTDEVPDVTQTETYKNDVLGVTLTHPTSWKTTETEDKGLRVESPEFNYLLADGNTQKGVLRIYIRLGARTNDQKIIGQGLAIRPSEQLAYANPLPGQRKDTYITHFGLNTTESFNFFMIAGNFNLKKGESLGPTYGKEADAYIIGGGYTSSATTNDLEMSSVPVDSFDQSKAYTQAIDILKSIQLR